MSSYRTLHAVPDDYAEKPLADRMALEKRDWVTSEEIAAETGASYRQVDYWIRTGLIHARGLLSPGAGHVRRFDVSELERVRTVVALLKAGIDLASVRDHLDHVIAHGGYQVGAVTVTYTPDHPNT